MNALDKIKNVTNGLNNCGSYSHLCSTCPYNDGRECERELHRDALEVINALRDELKKRTGKTVEAKPDFVILTVYGDSRSVAVRLDDILYVADHHNDGRSGSVVQLKGSDGITIGVEESIEEILTKISKGE